MEHKGAFLILLQLFCLHYSVTSNAIHTSSFPFESVDVFSKEVENAASQFLQKIRTLTDYETKSMDLVEISKILDAKLIHANYNDVMELTVTFSSSAFATDEESTKEHSILILTNNGSANPNDKGKVSVAIDSFPVFLQDSITEQKRIAHEKYVKERDQLLQKLRDGQDI